MSRKEDPADARGRWHATAGAQIPLDLGSVFQETDGFFARRRNEQRARLLAALAPLLGQALEPGEVIRYAVRAYLYSAAEYLLSGHLAALHTNQMALILTDRRLLWLQVDSKGRPKDLKNQIRLGRIRRTKRGWGGSWTVETVGREKILFNSIPGADRKALDSLIPGAPDAPKDASRSIEHLCPACVRSVPGPVGSVERCPNSGCGIPFRSPRKAAWLSALVPGVGDIYLRHFLFGSLEFVGSIAFLCVALAVGIEAAVTREPESTSTALLLAGFFVVLPRLLDFGLTLHMARKGLVPLSMTAPPRIEEGAPIGPSGPKPLPAFPVWSWGLFVLGGLAVGTTAWFSGDAATDQLRIAEACRLARAGRVEEARTIFDQATTKGAISANDRARFALALWERGDLEGGDQLVQGLGEIDKALADRLNAFLAKMGTATAEHDEGRRALLAGPPEKAWPPIDRAVAFFGTLPLASFPRSRHDVVIELAGELLAPPLAAEDLAAASRLVALAAALPGADARLELARLRLSTTGASGGGAEMPAPAEPATLGASWRLLALEIRADRWSGREAAVPIADAAEAISPAEILRLREDLQAGARARRGALMAFGGRVDRIPEAALEAAGELAASQGWAGAAESISGRLALTVSK